MSKLQFKLALHELYSVIHYLCSLVLRSHHFFVKCKGVVNDKQKCIFSSIIVKRSLIHTLKMHVTCVRLNCIEYLQRIFTGIDGNFHKNKFLM